MCATETEQELALQGRKNGLSRTALWDTDDSKVLLGNSERGGKMQMTARQKHVLGGNQYLAQRRRDRAQKGRRSKEEREVEVFWDWLRGVTRLFESYKQKPLTLWQNSSKGYREPSGTLVLDLFLVTGPKVRPDRFFTLSFCWDKLTFYTTFRREFDSCLPFVCDMKCIHMSTGETRNDWFSWISLLLFPTATSTHIKNTYWFLQLYSTSQG